MLIASTQQLSRSAPRIVADDGRRLGVMPRLRETRKRLAEHLRAMKRLATQPGAVFVDENGMVRDATTALSISIDPDRRRLELGKSMEGEAAQRAAADARALRFTTETKLPIRSVPPQAAVQHGDPTGPLHALAFSLRRRPSVETKVNLSVSGGDSFQTEENVRHREWSYTIGRDGDWRQLAAEDDRLVRRVHRRDVRNAMKGISAMEGTGGEIYKELRTIKDCVAPFANGHAHNIEHVETIRFPSAPNARAVLFRVREQDRVAKELLLVVKPGRPIALTVGLPLGDEGWVRESNPAQTPARTDYHLTGNQEVLLLTRAVGAMPAVN